jgi:hypothetical protein
VDLGGRFKAVTVTEMANGLTKSALRGWTLVDATFEHFLDQYARKAAEARQMALDDIDAEMKQVRKALSVGHSDKGGTLGANEFKALHARLKDLKARKAAA